MIKKWTITIPQLTGTARRRAYVYVPDEALEDPEARYPVLYMFDGHNVFYDEDATYGKSWGMAEFVEENHLPLIIAAVECNHDPNNGRLSEYSPYTFTNDKLGHIVGKGKITMDWLINEFKPYIDKHWPTRPEREYTFLAGSSMGGLMTLYGVMAYNHVFSRGAALSPSIWFAREKLQQMLTSHPVGGDTVLYMDYGQREMPFHNTMRKQFSRVAETMLDRGVLLECRIVPGGNHNEASWEQQIPFFMNTLLYGVEF